MADYSLLDSGNSRKLEKFGSVVLSRPESQAIWKTSLSKDEWDKADAIFDNTWKFKRELPESWTIDLAGLKFKINLNTFKHTGIFPEQKQNWQFIEKQAAGKKVLNLFGYTGGASLAAARAGAEVTH